jgi:uncharacterized membrane protein
LRNRRTLIWLLAGVGALVLALLAMKTAGSFWPMGGGPAVNEYNGFRHHGGFPRGFRQWAGPLTRPIEHGTSWLIVPFGMFTLLMQVGMLGISIVLWTKASGFLKWAGGIAGALILASLLNPVWAVLLILLAIYVTRRIYNRRSAPAASMPAASASAQSYSRGKFLDEWEMRNLKEEK